MSDKKVQIPEDGSRWVHVNDDRYVIEVTAVGRRRALVVGLTGPEFSVPLDRFGIDYVPVPPTVRPTPRACWATVSDDGHWGRCTSKDEALRIAREWGDRWVAPVVPDMDAAEWVPGGAS